MDPRDKTSLGPMPNRGNSLEKIFFLSLFSFESVKNFHVIRVCVMLKKNSIEQTTINVKFENFL